MNFILIIAIILLIYYIIYIKRNKLFPEITYKFIRDVPLPSKNDRVILISVHPDDETIACGGYLQRAKKIGSKIKIVLLTQGQNKTIEIGQRRFGLHYPVAMGKKETRRREFLKALNHLGLQKNAIIFDFSERRLNKEIKELKKTLKNLFLEYWPRFILYPSLLDKNKDHKIVGKIIEDICQEINREKMIFLKYLIHYDRYPRPYRFSPGRYLLPPARIVSQDPQWRKLNLTEEEKLNKLKALLEYKSQLRVPFLRNLLLAFIRKNEIFSVARYLKY